MIMEGWTGLRFYLVPYGWIDFYCDIEKFNVISQFYLVLPVSYVLDDGWIDKTEALKDSITIQHLFSQFHSDQYWVSPSDYLVLPSFFFPTWSALDESTVLFVVVVVVVVVVAAASRSWQRWRGSDYRTRTGKRRMPLRCECLAVNDAPSYANEQVEQPRSSWPGLPPLPCLHPLFPPLPSIRLGFQARRHVFLARREPGENGCQKKKTNKKSTQTAWSGWRPPCKTPIDGSDWLDAAGPVEKQKGPASGARDANRGPPLVESASVGKPQALAERVHRNANGADWRMECRRRDWWRWLLFIFVIFCFLFVGRKSFFFFSRTHLFFFFFFFDSSVPSLFGDAKKRVKQNQKKKGPACFFFFFSFLLSRLYCLFFFLFIF